MKRIKDIFTFDNLLKKILLGVFPSFILVMVGLVLYRAIMDIGWLGLLGLGGFILLSYIVGSIMGLKIWVNHE
jgi:hypothetical protein